MSQERHPQLGDLPDQIREQSAEVRRSFSEWWKAVQADPALLWSNTAVRIVLWIVFGLCAMLIVYIVTHAFAPAPATSEAPKPPPTATLYVACANPSCLKSYTVERPMDFKDWPIQCEKCAQRSVYRAILCPECRHWYAVAPGHKRICPFCKPKDEPPKQEKKSGSGNPDDDEDPWG